MAIYTNHEFEKELIEILGLKERHIRAITIRFEVDSLVTAEVEFFLNQDEAERLVEMAKSGYEFRIVSKEIK